MGDNTGIEWTDDTWNPIVGCSVVSPGCTNCYAMKMAARLEAMAPKPDGRGNHGLIHYDGTTQDSRAGAVWTGKVALAPDNIVLAPLRKRRARRIFVNSMGDLFHESVPDDWIDKVFAVMALAPQHTFQVLTKRPDRALAYFGGGPGEGWGDRNARITAAARLMNPALPDGWRAAGARQLDHVWFGTSAENQQTWEARRLPLLRLGRNFGATFLSAEPLLGPLDLDFRLDHCDLCGGTGVLARWPRGQCHVCHGKGKVMISGAPMRDGYARLSWVIAGGESGPRARPMHPDWARSLRDQCAAADVPFFFKQWGEWTPLIDRERDDPDWRQDYRFTYEHRGKMHWLNLAGGIGFHGERFHVMGRAGKRATGRLLDGREHNDMPKAIA